MAAQANVNVLVLRTAGINCDEETVHAWRMAGAIARRVHIDRLIESPSILDDAQVLTVPGGFSYGDDVAAGKILANQILLYLADALRRFVDGGKLVLGICNGFQVLLKAGLLPGWAEERPRASADAGQQKVTVAFNDSSRFEARWVHLQVCADHCCFLPGGALLTLPIAHAEGKVVADGDATLATLKDSGHVALRYVDEHGQPGGYPINPNGSVDDIAGLTDRTGRILGLMPHPERYVDRTQHPLWTRTLGTGRGGDRALSDERVPGNRGPDGLTIFRAAVDCLR